MQRNEVAILMDNNKKDNVTTSFVNESSETAPDNYPVSECKQFWFVFKRRLFGGRNDWAFMGLRFLAHVLVGFLIGALYYDIGDDGSKVLSNLGFLFFNVLFLTYTSMTISILTFALEMPVLLKESLNRWYSLKSYYLAITVFDIPFQILFCVIYVTMVYFLTSQPSEASRYFMFLETCLLISFVAQSVGLVIGAAMNAQIGVYLAPVISVPFLLFSGFFVSFSDMPGYLRWISYLSYIRYGFEGIVLSTYSFERKNLKCLTAYCRYKNSNIILEELDMKDAHFTLNIFALLIIFLVLRVAAYLLLHRKLKL